MVFNNNLLLGAAGASAGGVTPFNPTVIPNSVWLDGNADGLTIASSDMSDQDGKEFTLGTWFQLNEFGVTGAIFCAGDTGGYTSFRHHSDNKLYFQTHVGDAILNTNTIFRDTGWYHVLLSVDTTQVVTINRVRLFINGIEEAFTGTFPALNRVYDFNTQHEHEVGNSVENGGFEGYVAQSFMIGSKSIQQGDFSVTDFLETFTYGTNGVQNAPKDASGILALVDAGSSNSFLLKYENSSALGEDSSTNNNDFTATSMSSTNQGTNTPSKNYSIFNTLANGDQSSSDLGSFSLSNGNKTVSLSSSNQWLKTTIPFVMSGSNIIRTEFTIDTTTNGLVGITDARHTAGTYHTSAITIPGRGEVGLLADGSLVIDGNFGGSGYTSSWSNGDIIDVIVNLDVGAVWFARNGTLGGGASQAEIQAGTTTNAALISSFVRRTAGETFNFYVAQTNPSGPTFTYNSGQSSFSNSYSTITSLIDLNTADLSAPSDQGIDYFDATLYDGSGDVQRVGEFIPFDDPFTISNSVMFDVGEQRYLEHTYTASPAQTDDEKATLSFWIKNYFDVAGADLHSIISAANTFQIYSTSGETYIHVSASEFFRLDNSVLSSAAIWLHCVIQFNLTESGADKIKVFVNNVEQSSTSTSYHSASSTINLFGTSEHLIGDLAPHSSGNADYLPCYLAEFHGIDGLVKAPTDFGQVDTSTNRWVPKDYKTNVDAYGNRGFYLKFATAPSSGSGAGTNSAGTGYNFSQETDTTAWGDNDQFSDTPNKNFPTFDPLRNNVGTLSNGNLKIVTATDQSTTFTTFVIPASGKWYWEMDVVAYASGGGSFLGLIEAEDELVSTNPQGGYTTQVLFDTHSGTSDVYDIDTGTTWCNTPGNNNMVSNGDVLQFAYDADAGTFFIGNNNTYYRAGASRSTFANATTVGGTPFIAGKQRRFIIGRGGSSAETYELNFGQFSNTFSGSSTTFDAAADGFFVHSPPTGYKALNADNLSDTASKITAFAWIKNRETTDNHMLFDRIRGIGNDLHSNDGADEQSNANTVQKFLQRGVQVGDDVEVNTVNESYVLWQWLVGETGGSGSTTSPAGSLASTSLVASPQHFSIVSYTGTGSATTTGHGLGAAPEAIIVKNRSQGDSWAVYHSGINSDAETDFLVLDTAAAFSDDATMWNDAVPTASVFSIGTNHAVNASSENYIAYCFRSVEGVCKVGSYLGNGSSTRPPYVALDFRPRFVMIKNASTARDWIIVDTAISPINPAELFLFPNLNIAEAARGSASGSDYDIDLLSGAFLPYTGDSAPNGDGDTIIYIAMADIGGNGTLPPIYGR